MLTSCPSCSHHLLYVHLTYATIVNTLLLLQVPAPKAKAPAKPLKAVPQVSTMLLLATLISVLCA